MNHLTVAREAEAAIPLWQSAGELAQHRTSLLEESASGTAAGTDRRSAQQRLNETPASGHWRIDGNGWIAEGSAEEGLEQLACGLRRAKRNTGLNDANVTHSLGMNVKTS